MTNAPSTHFNEIGSHCRSDRNAVARLITIQLFEAIFYAETTRACDAPQGRYKDYMKTVSLTEARQNLTQLVRRAIHGEDVGLVCDGKIVALRAVEVYSEDYALVEYDLKASELRRAALRVQAEVAAERKAGGLRERRATKKSR